MEYAWKMPYPYKFLHILQTTPTIILKFLVSNFLSILVKKIKKNENFAFPKFDRPHMSKDLYCFC